MVTHDTRGPFDRLSGALVNCLFGLLMITLAALVIWFNESAAVSSYNSLSEGLSLVSPVGSDRVDDYFQGRLVHVIGVTATTEQLSDPDFGLLFPPAISVHRTVEQFQWSERAEKKVIKHVGGSEETVTSYTYAPVWSDKVIASAEFHDQNGHQNPGSIPYPSRTTRVQSVSVGAFSLSDSVSAQLPQDSKPASLSTAMLPPGAYVDGDSIYYGYGNSQQPYIGDLRIRHTYTPAGGEVTIVARQRGSVLDTFQTRSGSSLLMVSRGALSPEAVFASARWDVAVRTWVLRFVGFFVALLGFSMLSSPLQVVADLEPHLIGRIVGLSRTLLAVGVALPFTLLVIGVAWLWYRPVVSAVLFGLGVVGFLAVRTKTTAPVARAHAE